jgi:uncharacterized membrane protein required for colicin V production
VGVIIAFFAASRLYLPVSSWVDEFFFGYPNLGKVIVFFLLFGIINRLVGFLFYLADRLFHIFHLIPFFKTFNKLAGAVLGFFTGSLFLGSILYVVARYSVLEHWFGQWLVDSGLAPYFLKVANLLLPLLPEMLKKLESLI